VIVKPIPDNQSLLEIKLSQAAKKLKVEPEYRVEITMLLEPLKAKDLNSYEHSLRVCLLAIQIGEFLHLQTKALLFAGLLHDIGKADVPDEILKKIEGWNEEDDRIIRKHVLNGYKQIKGKFDFTAEIILLHHEYQKNRYPENLPLYLHPYSKETQLLIFEYARVLALADVYDALHRKNDKYGKKRRLSGTEIKNKMLELNSDQKQLIEDLYKANILLDKNG
jgi:putative nucleotidyltransferase with HDIG domain